MMAAILKKLTSKEEKNRIKIDMELKKANAVISFMADGLLLVDKNLKITLANQAAGVMLRKAPKELAGKKLGSVFRLEERGEKIQLDKIMLEKVILGHDILRFGSEKQIGCLVDGDKSFSISFTASPFWTDDMTGLIIVFRDSTRERELEDSKDNFISITSHQLRTPLTSMRWNAEMLNEALEENSQRKEMAEEIYQGTLRLNETISLILSLSRSESGRSSEKIDQVNLTKLVAETMESLKLIIKAKKQKVTVHIPKNIADFEFPIAKLHLALNNIVLNASSYTKNGGKIDISFKKKSGAKEVICSVRDNGIGIPKNKQGKIFQKFFRAPNAVKAMPNGSGLGLVLAKALIESWEGEIWFESKENKGTTFYFTMPLNRVF